MSAINITAREQELLCAVLEVMKADINWPEVARIGNYNTPKQARDRWPIVRKKLIEGSGKATGSGDDSAAATPTTKPKKTPASRKRKAADEDDAEDATPSKRSKTPKGKKADTPVAEDDDEKDTVNGNVKAEPTEGEDDDYL
ncbi:hypothetical protein CB0940_07049 [Cercospora beticola]|uniref:Myb-like domain-containing protein n=1 Tax=Cercospora beticola TaxID=122368 RepID=A0A2G5HA84_CERBT|nr:hypothetical protein CB0940_07049 [Cercospora beticola]PIA89203.1 hypothetical protein CB0940_07049 [Cercospora beticola]WPB02973.1 hypothetical protein RHO25_007609 [Cercospora beticola]CAK1358327.1 unnamed protein product [Cercospora beticola]